MVDTIGTWQVTGHAPTSHFRQMIVQPPKARGEAHGDAADRRRRRGRPSLFTQRAIQLAESGLYQDDIARALDVSLRALARWRIRYPEFKAALARGRARRLHPENDCRREDLARRGAISQRQHPQDATRVVARLVRDLHGKAARHSDARSGASFADELTSPADDMLQAEPTRPKRYPPDGGVGADPVDWDDPLQQW